MVEGEDINIAHRKYFVLNDFEDILDIIGDSKEIGNDFEEDSESVSNTKVMYYACFFSFFDHLFKSERKVCKKTSFAYWVASSIMLQSYRNCAEIKN